MNVWKKIFYSLAIVFGVAAFLNLLPYHISWPFMSVFLGLAVLTNAKEYYANGNKVDAIIFGAAAIFLYALIAFMLLSWIL